MSTLHYNIQNVVNLTDIDANVNAEKESTLDDDYDLAFFGVGNFLVGNYTQNNADPDSIKSSIDVKAAGVSRMRMFYASDASATAADKRTLYGNFVDTTKDFLFFGNVVSKVETETGDNVDLRGPGTGGVSTYANSIALYPLVNLNSATAAIDSANDSLKKNKCSVGDGLLQLVSAAIFKKLGKNAALINDNTIVNNINSNFHTSLKTGFGETNASYNDSAFFKRYLESGRYASDNPDINGSVVDYSMNDTVVNFILKLTGDVSDVGGTVAMTSDNITQIFGTIGTGNSAHKINTSAGYEIKAFVSLRNDNRF